MKFKLSKLHLALIAAGFGSSLCATTFAQTAQSFPVVVPVNQASFYGAVTGLWATPTNDDLFYAVVGPQGASGTRSFHNIDPDYQWGFRLDAGVFMADSGNDLSINWTYFSTDDDDSVASLNNVHSRYLPVFAWDRVDGSAGFDFNEINLVVGQKVDFCSLNTRFTFGLSYASIDHDFDSAAILTTVAGGVTTVTTARGALESDFKGLGPVLGVDVAYPLGGGCSPVSLVGHAAGALLIGKLTIDEDADTSTVVGTGSPVLADFRNEADDVWSVYPGATLKLGLKYSSNPDPGTCGYAVEFGYQTTGYYQVVSHGLDTDKAARTGINYDNSNFGIGGWYLTLAYAG